MLCLLCVVDMALSNMNVILRMSNDMEQIRPTQYHHDAQISWCNFFKILCFMKV